MISKIKELIFPCEQRMKSLMQQHSTAVQDNATAHDALMKACRGSACRPVNVFPALQENHIVNPR